VERTLVNAELTPILVPDLDLPIRQAGNCLQFASLLLADVAAIAEGLLEGLGLVSAVGLPSFAFRFDVYFRSSCKHTSHYIHIK